MRLTKQEVQIIKSAILQVDPEARIFLFGSRVDDQKKGGDIDLDETDPFVQLALEKVIPL